MPIYKFICLSVHLYIFIYVIFFSLLIVDFLRTIAFVEALVAFRAPFAHTYKALGTSSFNNFLLKKTVESCVLKSHHHYHHKTF